jgi:hypothetical protein
VEEKCCAPNFDGLGRFVLMIRTVRSKKDHMAQYVVLCLHCSVSVVGCMFRHNKRSSSVLYLPENDAASPDALPSNSVL